MADKPFGIKQLYILGGGTPTIQSGNDLNLNANTVAISTNLTVGNKLSITSTGIVTASSGVVTYFGDGSNLTGVGDTSNVSTSTLNVVGVSTFSDTVTITKAASPLKVNALTTNAAIEIQRSGSTKAYLTPESGEFRIQTYSSEDIALQTNTGGGTAGDITFKSLSTEILKVKGTGNVGIHSTVPTSRLDVVGDAKVSGVVTATSFYGDGSNLSGIATTGGAGFTPDAQYNLYAGTCAGNASDADTCFNIALGCRAAQALNAGDDNIALGRNAAVSLTSGNYNLYFGLAAGCNSATVSNNMGIGKYTGKNYCTSAECNISIGVYAASNRASGCRNIALGASALCGAEGQIRKIPGC